ncbi:MAG: hypothetical protein GKR91_14050 [Pseudomonadales bacterium]|nr:hypothetical protein [Pseudomonadales bacterium]
MIECAPQFEQVPKVRFLLLIFIIVPLVEMMLLFEVADVIGGWSTLALVVLTAVIGVQILKRQGLSTLLRAQQRLQSGELPAQEIVEGMMLAGAGALLLTPGFITDTLGFIFLTGPLRRPIAWRIIRSGVVKAMGAGASSGSFEFRSSQSQSSYREQSNVYEGEYSEDGLSQIGPREPKKGPND